MRVAIVVVVMAGCWRAPSTARPATPQTAPQQAATHEPSYRNVTLAIDAVGVGMIAGGMLFYRARGLDSSAGHLLVATGGLAAGVGTPIVHIARGHGARGGASYLIRSGLASTGVIVAMAASCADESSLFCDLSPNLWWGVAGGLAVAGVLDAIVLHGPSSTWTPVVTPTDKGANVGVSTRF